eukprot:GAHX01003698.1.p3 GENE.GAHX01003698.1~~GAHX01003698.1.p3  ORF type:complete len:55 (-),score=3.35 GAHX01003698.1:14-178(-)
MDNSMGSTQCLLDDMFSILDHTHFPCVCHRNYLVTLDLNEACVCVKSEVLRMCV